MKKLIFSLGLAALAASAFGQGTVSFSNLSNSGGGLVQNNGTNASGAVTLELFYGPVGSTLAQLMAGGTGFGDVVYSTTISTAIAGKFIDGSTVTTLQPLGAGTSDTTLNVELAIAGWTGSGYANYAAAAGVAPTSGITAAWANPTGGGGTPASPPAGLIKWVSANNLNMIGTTPEPATIALGGLGAAALLLFRRRK